MLRDDLVKITLEWERKFGVAPGITGSVSEYDAAMLVGSKPFDYLKELYHFGIRSENYFDCSKLRRLSIEGGAFVKCVLELPSAEEFNDFMSEDFSKHRDFSWFKQKILHDYRSSIALLDYMESLPEDTDFGYDYEGSGMPLDRWYELGNIITIVDIVNR